MKQTQEVGYQGRIIKVKETLTDGSKVYNIQVGNMNISCSDQKAADKLWDTLTDDRFVIDIS
jgi:hypothetical protein